MKTINEIVKQMLEEHEGGERFFDNLDDAIRNNNELLEYFLKEYVYDDEFIYNIDGIIVSGQFGRVIQNSTNISYDTAEYYSAYFISVNGGLRKGCKVEEFDSYLSDRIDMDFLFLDDSFYSGKTRNAIRNKLEEYGHNLSKTIVLYDGSKNKDESVISMYRYYDNH